MTSLFLTCSKVLISYSEIKLKSLSFRLLVIICGYGRSKSVTVSLHYQVRLLRCEAGCSSAMLPRSQLRDAFVQLNLTSSSSTSSSVTSGSPFGVFKCLNSGGTSPQRPLSRACPASSVLVVLSGQVGYFSVSFVLVRIEISTA